LSLAHQHLYAAPWANNHFLSIYRVFCFAILWTTSLYHLINNTNPSLLYFTNWGIYLTTITYTFLFIFTVRQYLCKKDKESVMDTYSKNFYSPWRIWKWGIFFYETSLTFEIIITLFFWAVLVPGLSEESKRNPWTFIDHIAPIIILGIDYCLNRIPFNLRHLPISMGMMLAYGVVNMSYTLATGHPIYDPLTYKDVMSFVWMILLAALEGGGYYGFYHLTNWKLSKVHH
jgi:hypothetical protein